MKHMGFGAVAFGIWLITAAPVAAQDAKIDLGYVFVRPNLRANRDGGADARLCGGGFGTLSGRTR